MLYDVLVCVLRVCMNAILSWFACLLRDLSALTAQLKWYKLAQNRQACRQLVATVRT